MSAVAKLDERDVASAAAPAGEAGALISMIERAVRDPSVDMDKMERLFDMHAKATARAAEVAYADAMSAAQAELSPVAADANNPQTRSRYATYAALDRAVRPIYGHHGFALSFGTGETPKTDHLRLTCKVTHRGGHSEHFYVDMPADGKGAKGGDVMTKTHATGAAMTYGQRYLLKLIFNMAIGDDDDGASGQKPISVHQARKEGGNEKWKVVEGAFHKAETVDELNDARDTHWDTIMAFPKGWQRNARELYDARLEELSEAEAALDTAAERSR